MPPSTTAATRFPAMTYAPSAYMRTRAISVVMPGSGAAARMRAAFPIAVAAATASRPAPRIHPPAGCASSAQTAPSSVTSGNVRTPASSDEVLSRWRPTIRPRPSAMPRPANRSTGGIGRLAVPLHGRVPFAQTCSGPRPMRASTNRRMAAWSVHPASSMKSAATTAVSSGRSGSAVSSARLCPQAGSLAARDTRSAARPRPPRARRAGQEHDPAVLQVVHPVAAGDGRVVLLVAGPDGIVRTRGGRVGAIADGGALRDVDPAFVGHGQRGAPRDGRHSRGRGRAPAASAAREEGQGHQQRGEGQARTKGHGNRLSPIVRRAVKSAEAPWKPPRLP